VFFHAAELTEFCFHHEALSVSKVHDLLGDGCIFFEGLGRSVNHDGAVEARVDAVNAGFFVTVVQVHCEHCFRENLVGSADHIFKHKLVGVAASTLRNLNDEGSLAFNAALEKAHALLHVVDIVSTNGILTVSVLEEFLRCDDHADLSFSGFKKNNEKYTTQKCF
jgi:hypothetical protein